MMTKYISVGKIVNFHGIKGEARVGYSKNQQEFFLSLKSVFVKTGNEYRELNIDSVRQNKNFLIVKFEGTPRLICWTRTAVCPTSRAH